MTANPETGVQWRDELPTGPLPGRARQDDGPSRRWPLVVAGGLGMVLALVALAVPALASVGTAIFTGWILLCASVVIAFEAFSRRGLGRRLIRLVIAGVTFAAALYLLLSPLEGAFTLTVMLVIWFVAVGFARIVTGLGELGERGAGLMILNGAVSLGLGLLIGNELPSSADWAIGLLVGVDLFVFSAMALWVAFAGPRG